MPRPDYLHFVVRRDLSWRQRACQLIHAMDEWAAAHGAHRGPVIVFGARDEAELLANASDDSAVFHEPHLGGEATALARRSRPDGLSLA